MSARQPEAAPRSGRAARSVLLRVRLSKTAPAGASPAAAWTVSSRRAKQPRQPMVGIAYSTVRRGFNSYSVPSITTPVSVITHTGHQYPATRGRGEGLGPFVEAYVSREKRAYFGVSGDTSGLGPSPLLCQKQDSGPQVSGMHLILDRSDITMISCLSWLTTNRL